MKYQILISSYKGDFVWLNHCLRSLAKFADGFLPTVVSVDFCDLEECRYIIQKSGADAEAFVHSVPRPYAATAPGLGMMRAMNSMMHGDLLCPEADVVFLVGSDCLAVDDFLPEPYLDKHRRPVILYNSYEKIRAVHADALPWRDGTAQVLGFTPPHEFMRRLPSVFRRETFSGCRKYIEDLHGMPFQAYWFGGYAAGQRGQSEANLLGAFEYRFFPERSAFVSLDETPAAVCANYPNALLQFWSHGGLEKPIDTHFLLPSGDVVGRTPASVIAEVLSDDELPAAGETGWA